MKYWRLPFKNVVWGGNCEIQAFSEIYSVNVNIHEL